MRGERHERVLMGGRRERPDELAGLDRAARVRDDDSRPRIEHDFVVRGELAVDQSTYRNERALAKGRDVRDCAKLGDDVGEPTEVACAEALHEWRSIGRISHRSTHLRAIVSRVIR
jgi:hypothetical protein